MIAFLRPTDAHDPAMDPFLDAFFRTLQHPVVMTFLALIAAVLFARRFLLKQPSTSTGSTAGASASRTPDDSGSIACAATMAALGSDPGTDG